MKKRGEVYRSWLDTNLPHLSHEETLDDGTELDVRVRLSRTGATQMFIGIYAQSGEVHEVSDDHLPGETTTRALVTGVGMARKWVWDDQPGQSSRRSNKAVKLSA